jgi:hypothetical protein
LVECIRIDKANALISCVRLLLVVRSRFWVGLVRPPKKDRIERALCRREAAVRVAGALRLTSVRKICSSYED